MSLQSLPGTNLSTHIEIEVQKKIAELFERNDSQLESKLDNFPKYIRRQKLTRLLALYEIFKRVLSIKGSIVECGVFQGASLMTWANLSAVLEPTNITRRIYGFDTFEGFSNINKQDENPYLSPKKGDFNNGSYEELVELLKVYDKNRFLGHIQKVQLIKGDIVNTIPEFLNTNKHLVISLLFLDMDLYEPTKVALQHFLPRMPKGSIIAFDELDNPIWPGETLALLETFGISNFKIERLDFDPYIGFSVIN